MSSFFVSFFLGDQLRLLKTALRGSLDVELVREFYSSAAGHLTIITIGSWEREAEGRGEKGKIIRFWFVGRVWGNQESKYDRNERKNIREYYVTEAYYWGRGNGYGDSAKGVTNQSESKKEQ